MRRKRQVGLGVLLGACFGISERFLILRYSGEPVSWGLVGFFIFFGACSVPAIGFLISRSFPEKKAVFPLFLSCSVLAAALFILLQWQEVGRTYRLTQRDRALLAAPLSASDRLGLTRFLQKAGLSGNPALHKRKVVVLGFDGLDWEMLDPLMREGILPHFKKLTGEGAYGTLRSILPPSSAGAWPAAVTGCGPGSTSLLTFRKMDPKTKTLFVPNGLALREPTLWDILTEEGKRSIVINVPMSYPPHPISGILVTDLMTPEGKLDTAPRDLSGLLKKIGYKREASLSGYGSISSWSKDIEDYLLVEKKRMELALFLFEKSDWDFLMCMFGSNDRILHHVPNRFSGKDLRRNFILMDGILGKFLERLDEQTVLFVISDHGFRRYEWRFSVPAWLEKEGLLAAVSQKRGVRTFRSALGVPDIPLLRMPSSLRPVPFLGLPVDWRKTRAVCLETAGNWGTIRIEASGKERDVLRETIRGKLKNLKGPDHFPLIRHIFSREEVYHGPFVDEMPDLVFELSQDVYADFLMAPSPILEKWGRYHHRREGVLAVWGNGIRHRFLSEGASLEDIAPTVLYALSGTIPDRMEGRVLQETMSDSLEETLGAPRWGPLSVSITPPLVPPEKTSSDLWERLHSLGYVQ